MGFSQGDNFSPLFFIVSLIPLSLLLRRSNLGYKLSSCYVINYLLFMDDLKLYSRTEKEIKSLLNTVGIFSVDIGMSFGIGKYAHIGIRRGNIYESNGVELPSRDVIRSLSYGQTYKYLGVKESCDIDHGLVREKVASKYKHRFKLILYSQLCGNYKFRAINTFAIPVLRYSAAIVQWPVNTLNALERHTRKLLTLFWGLHPNLMLTVCITL